MNITRIFFLLMFFPILNQFYLRHTQLSGPSIGDGQHLIFKNKLSRINQSSYQSKNLTDLILKTSQTFQDDRCIGLGQLMIVRQFKQSVTQNMFQGHSVESFVQSKIISNIAYSITLIIYMIETHNYKSWNSCFSIIKIIIILISMQGKLLIILLLATFAVSKIVYVATVFRHGARYPLGDIYDGNQTKQFHGRLTSVGMRQLFLLGGYVKADYIDKLKLINSTLYPKQVEVFADGSERCIESASSFLLGMFPFGSGPRLPENLDPKYLNPPFTSVLKQKLQRQVQATDFATNLGFQPVPYINATRFFISCPNQNSIIAKRIQSLAVKLAQFQAVHAAFTEKMRIVFKLPAEFANVAGLAELFDVVICDLNLGRPMPAQFTDYDFKQLRYIENFLFSLIYQGHVAPIFSTSILSAILGNMDNMIKKGKDEIKRFSIYSGHDSNLVPLLNYLNLTSSECITKKWKNETISGNCADVPPFASNLIFQLHQNDTNPSQHYVRIRYNGQYYAPCQTSSKECQYTNFARRVRTHFVDVNKECGIKSDQQEGLPGNDLDADMISERVIQQASFVEGVHKENMIYLQE